MSVTLLSRDQIKPLYTKYFGASRGAATGDNELDLHTGNPGGFEGVEKAFQESSEYGDTIKGFYNQYLGREAKDADVNPWRTYAGGYEGVKQGILNSNEYKQRQSGGGSGSVQDFIAQWQRTHSASEGIGPLAAAIAQQFPGVSRYMYGQTPSNNELLVNGQKYKVLGGEDSPNTAYWYQPGMDDSGGRGGGGGGTGGAGGPGTGIPGVDLSSYIAQFNDPSTRFLEDLTRTRLDELFRPVNDPARQQYADLLQQQTNLLRSQQEQMGGYAASQQARRGETDAAVKRLSDFINQRVGKLQAPAYTGTEQEIMRTQALEPIERDRQAAQQRALDNIGSRGFDPSSGIAQELINMVDAGYDQQRAGAQGDLAYKQIQEQRARDQEAQQLLSYLSELPMAAGRGDMEYVSYLNNLVNQPGREGLDTANALTGVTRGVRAEEQGRRQEALALSSMLADLGPQRLQLALATMGQGPSPAGTAQGYLQLLQNSQNNRYINTQQQGSYFSGLGQMLGYSMGQGGWGGGGGSAGGGGEYDSFLYG